MVGLGLTPPNKAERCSTHHSTLFICHSVIFPVASGIFQTCFKCKCSGKTPFCFFNFFSALRDQSSSKPPAATTGAKYPRGQRVCSEELQTDVHVRWLACSLELCKAKCSNKSGHQHLSKKVLALVRWFYRQIEWKHCQSHILTQVWNCCTNPEKRLECRTFFSPLLFLRLLLACPASF